MIGSAQIAFGTCWLRQLIMRQQLTTFKKKPEAPTPTAETYSLASSCLPHNQTPEARDTSPFTKPLVTFLLSNCNSTSMVWPTLGSRTAKEQNRTATNAQVMRWVMERHWLIGFTHETIDVKLIIAMTLKQCLVSGQVCEDDTAVCSKPHA